MRHTRTKDDRRTAAGFTLIELLVVISIIGILAAIATYSFNKTRSRSVESACRSDYKSIELAMEAYKTKTGAYPSQSTLQTPNATILKSYPSGNGYTFAINNTTGVITVSGTKVAGGPGLSGCDGNNP